MKFSMLWELKNNFLKFIDEVQTFGKFKDQNNILFIIIIINKSREKKKMENKILTKPTHGPLVGREYGPYR